MNIQIYYLKKNFDYQKAERYFKERRIPFQGLDLKKHRLGDREIRMMLEAFGMDKLLDREDKKVREHPACYFSSAELLIPEIRENPWLMKTPIVRNGNRFTLGYQPEIWNSWN